MSLSIVREKKRIQPHLFSNQILQRKEKREVKRGKECCGEETTFSLGEGGKESQSKYKT
jgi:hypothetical protein